MNLKTYRGSTMAQALAEVKKDLGKDAVILHTRVHRAGTLLGMGGKQVVEITASDQAPARRPRPVPEDFQPVQFPTREPSASLVRVAPGPAPAARPASQPAPQPTPQSALRPAPEPSFQPTPQPAPRSAPAVAPALAVRAEPAPVDAAAATTLHAELASIRRLVGQVLQVTRAGAARSAAAPILASGGLPDPLAACYASLLDAGVQVDLADAIVSQVRDALSAAELGDPAIARQGVLTALASRLPVIGAMVPAARTAADRPLTIALVGPTGVGKTTTIAKLAAAYKLRQGKRVGLVTCDTYRIAAVEQLRVYAGIIGVPLKVALAPEDVAECCAALRDLDVVIVDTPGRGQRDSSKLEELTALVTAAAPDQTHLVLSAGVAEPVLRSAAERFARVRPDRLLISKLDEAMQYGPLVNVAQASRLPLSYVTMGQEVPDHIELASAPRLATLVLDGPSAQGWGE